jgi:hypothetical protein
MRRVIALREPGSGMVALSSEGRVVPPVPGLPQPFAAIQLHVAQACSGARLRAALPCGAAAEARPRGPGWVELPLAGDAGSPLRLSAEGGVALSVAAGCGLPFVALRLVEAEEGAPIPEAAWEGARILGRGALLRAGTLRPLLLLRPGEAAFVTLPSVTLAEPATPRLSLLRGIAPLAGLWWGGPEAGARAEWGAPLQPGEGPLTLGLRAGAPAELVWDGI